MKNLINEFNNGNFNKSGKGKNRVKKMRKSNQYYDENFQTKNDNRRRKNYENWKYMEFS